MQPLDLAIRAPRGPRVRIAGIVFTARLIDKLRASLPGGNPSGFLPFIGFSEMWAYCTGVDLIEFQQVVLEAASEGEVERWLLDQTQGIDKPAINAQMERFKTDRTPAPMRELFEALYPADLRARFPVLFDLLEADDARLYAVAR